MSFFGWLTGSPDNTDTDNVSTKPESEYQSTLTSLDPPPTESKTTTTESTSRSMYKKRSTIDIVQIVTLWLFVLGSVGLNIYLMYNITNVNKDLTDDLKDEQNDIKHNFKDVNNALGDTKKGLDDVNNKLTAACNAADHLQTQHNRKVKELEDLDDKSQNYIDTIKKRVIKNDNLVSTFRNMTRVQNETITKQQRVISMLNRTIKLVLISSNTSVFFSAGLTQDRHLTKNKTLIFDKVFVSVTKVFDGYGDDDTAYLTSGYSSTTGRFVAPVGGHYMFTVHVQSQRDRDVDLRIVHLGNEIAAIRVTNHESANDFNVASNTVILKLSSRDVVRVRAFGDSWIQGLEFPATTFTGVLLYYLP